MTQYANQYSHSDVTPFEVVRVISDKTIEIREMLATKAAGEKLEFHAGGFSAHCSNQQAQKWDITPNEQAQIIRARKQKDGTFKSIYGKHRLSDTPVKFYDYNF